MKDPSKIKVLIACEESQRVCMPAVHVSLQYRCQTPVERWETTGRTCDSRHTSKRLIDSAKEDALSTSLRELEEELERDG